MASTESVTFSFTFKNSESSIPKEAKTLLTQLFYILEDTIIRHSQLLFKTTDDPTFVSKITIENTDTILVPKE